MTKDISKYIIKNKYKDDASLTMINIITKLRKRPMLGFAVLALVFIVMGLMQRKDLGIGLVDKSTISLTASLIVYCIVGLGFCVLLGYSALASLGTGGFIAIGSYFAYFCLVQWGLTVGLTFIIAIIAAAVIGVAVGFISLRIEGIYLAIVTLGISQVIIELFPAIMVKLIGQTRTSISKGDIVFAGIEGLYMSAEDIYIVMVLVLFLLIFITKNLMDSPTGRAMLAMKNSTSAAQAFGISLMKYRLFAFVISTMYAAIAGVLYMLYFRGVDKGQFEFSLSASLSVLGAIIIGGTKSIWGTFGGTLLIVGLEKIFKISDIATIRENSGVVTIFCGLLVILVVMFYPGGLVQLVKELMYKIKKLAHKAKEYRYGVEE